MKIHVLANGHGTGKGTHVSVSTQLFEGRYDNQINWPFLGTVTYKFLNQLRDENLHRRVDTYTIREDMKVGKIMVVHTKFFPHSSLVHNPATNTQYLLDDTLYFRVSVNVDNHKPWVDCTHHS